MAADTAYVSALHYTKFYVNRVFIADGRGELWPQWLNRVKGMGEAEDTSSSIPRDTLLWNNVLRATKRNLVEKRVDMPPETHGKKDDDTELSVQYGSKLGVTELYVPVGEGVADFVDSPLNILRGTLQQCKALRVTMQNLGEKAGRSDRGQ